jgi:hypothetical protein
VGRALTNLLILDSPTAEAYRTADITLQRGFKQILGSGNRLYVLSQNRQGLVIDESESVIDNTEFTSNLVAFSVAGQPIANETGEIIFT